VVALVLGVSPLLVATLLALAPAPCSQERPDPALLVEQARALLPRYEGDAIEFLTAEQRREVEAADHLFQAGLALQGESPYALWWGGHARMLLAEDARNRGQLERAARFDAGALVLFDRAVVLDPTYHWAFYARAQARRSSGALFEALEDFGEAVRLAEAVLEEGDGSSSQDALLVRFKARQWGADTRMGVFQFEQAREEFRTFYAENGNNPWDLAYSLAESYQRERDFAGARRIYEGVLEDEALRSFDSTYSQLAYLAGLVGDTGEALRRLDEAFERERMPSLYPRLWCWLLARGPAWRERCEAARAELEQFLAAPPSSLSAWDATLGAFMLGRMEEEAFVAAAREEHERRAREAVPLDGLGCEVAFYRGMRAELDAVQRPLESAERLAEALSAYEEALAFDPVAFKWEWAYARQGYGRVAGRLGRSEVGRLRVGGEVLDPGAGFGPVRWHRPGEATSEPLSRLRGVELGVGDLLLGYRLGGAGKPRALFIVCAPAE